MLSFYIILVAMLLLLAIFDLFVGVSNDAVNFLNSAVGSKAFKFRTLLIFAAVGVFCGAAFSNGMMDIARHGIFMPEYYTFAELITVFVAVMLTDVILLDFFNSLGMPTSTTVSLVFELLGASVAVACIKVAGNDSLVLGELINTSKALSVIMGIFVSVAVAFSVGTVVQYLTRLVFTFGYKKNLKYFIGIFGGVSLTSIFYFILIKGLKNMSFVGPEYKQFIVSNEGALLLGMFGSFFVLSHLLHALKVNVLKVIIGFGTFSLALAFAGNDLVNFVGVPLTGLSSLQHLLADGGIPEEYTMGVLMKSEPGQWYLLLLAGVVMVLALVLSKKSQNVLRTSVGLASQNSSEEIFGTNPVARALVRGCRVIGKFAVSLMPAKMLKAIDSRFDTRKITLEQNDAAFDLLRACVNLMLASSLIALGTSLKLPLSTTYVTFMVAMGSSLADRAWSRESAVFRITGILSVIGGWFATAFVAFALAGIVAVALYYGGFVAKFVLFAIVVWHLVRSNLRTREQEKDASIQRFEKILTASPDTKVYPLIQEYCRIEWSEILNWSADCYRDITTYFLRENLSGLRLAHKQIKILKKHIERNRRHGSLCTELLAKEDMVNKNFFLYQANDFMGDILFCLQQISAPCKAHVDNNFAPLSLGQRKVLLRFTGEIQSAVNAAAGMVADQNFGRYEEIRNNLMILGRKIQDERKLQMLNENPKVDPADIRNTILYLMVLYESKAMLDAVASFIKASRKFLTEKEN